MTPFTFSLLVYVFLLPGLYLTARRRVWAGYWLAVAVPVLLLVVSVHFLPTEGYEPPSHIYTPYADPLGYSQTPAGAIRANFFRGVYAPVASPIWGVLAVADMLALVASCVALSLLAIRARLRTGRW